MNATALTAQQIADMLNAYTGDNIFQDVVYGFDSYDPEATELADPSGRMDVYVFAGAEVRYDYDRAEWYVA
jgi:hypothetical protein